MAKRKEDKAKQPWLKTYTGDWLKKTVRLTLMAKGAFMDLRVAMWDNEPRGEITETLEGFARLFGCSEKDAETALNLLEQKNCICLTFANDLRTITATDPDMKHEIYISEIRAKVAKDAKTGDASKFAGAKSKQIASAKAQAKEQQKPDSDSDYDYDYIKSNKEPLKIWKSLNSDRFGHLMDIVKMQHGSRTDLYPEWLSCFIHHSASELPPDSDDEWMKRFSRWMNQDRKFAQTKNSHGSNPKDKHSRSLAEDFAKRHGDASES